MPQHPPRRRSRRTGRARRGRRRARRDAPPAAAPDYIVEVEGLTKVFNVRGQKEDFVAVKDVSFAIPRGETVAIVGESGSGKTTTARMVLKVVDPTSGVIRFDGEDVASLKGKQLSSFRQRVQPIFQDPYSSLNPMFSIERIITEPLDLLQARLVEGALGARAPAAGRRRPAADRCCGGIRPSSPAASVSASRSRARSPSLPTSSCATSRFRRWTCSCRTRS